MKWIAEYADLHGIQIAPHGVFDGLIGLAAYVQVAAALPQNYIAFEYPLGQPDWWYQIVDGLPDPIMKAGFIDVWDRPGLGVTFNVAAAKPTSQLRIVTSSTEATFLTLSCLRAASNRHAEKKSPVPDKNRSGTIRDLLVWSCLRKACA